MSYGPASRPKKVFLVLDRRRIPIRDQEFVVTPEGLLLIRRVAQRRAELLVVTVESQVGVERQSVRSLALPVAPPQHLLHVIRRQGHLHRELMAVVLEVLAGMVRLDRRDAEVV